MPRVDHRRRRQGFLCEGIALVGRVGRRRRARGFAVRSGRVCRRRGTLFTNVDSFLLATAYAVVAGPARDGVHPRGAAHLRRHRAPRVCAGCAGQGLSGTASLACRARLRAFVRRAFLPRISCAWQAPFVAPSRRGRRSRARSLSTKAHGLGHRPSCLTTRARWQGPSSMRAPELIRSPLEVARTRGMLLGVVPAFACAAR